MTAGDGKGLLAGIRVVDLSSSWVGAHMGLFFADQGAEVVCVEPPGGSSLRGSAAWAFLGRGKHSVVADLARPEGVQRARRLARAADVVVETWRPGTAERMGLGYDDLAAGNPGLVYTSVSGFGSKGPLAGLAGYEALVMAKLGFAVQFTSFTPRGGPAYCSVPYATFSAAHTALHGTLAALYERERSGLGQRVESSLAQGMAAQDPWRWFLAFIARQYPEAYEAAAPIGDDGVPNHSFAFRLLVALSSDGHWMQFSQVSPHLFAAFLRALGLDWMLDHPEWSSVPEFDDRDRRQELWERMLTAVRSRTLAQWNEVFDEDPDVWAEVFRHGAELLDHPQVVHDGRVVSIEDPERGPVRQPGPLVADRATGRGCGGPPPGLGCDAVTASWEAAPRRPVGSDAEASGAAPLADVDAGASGTAPLADVNGGASGVAPLAGVDAGASGAAPLAGVDAAASGAAPLAGVAVVEFGTYYAAPYAGAILADFGARVIKVESLAGEPMRTIMGFPEAGAAKSLQGKQSIALDLNTGEGRAVVHRLVAGADIVMQSYRAGAAARLGIDAASLQAVNPDVVYVSSPGYGPGGPCGHRPAFAPTIGAGAGAGWRNVGPAVDPSGQFDLDGVKEASLRLGMATQVGGNADGCSAVVVASAMLAGLLGARRGNGTRHGGTTLATSMLTTMAHVLCEDCVVYEGRPPTPAADPELYGLSAAYRLYRAARGWVFLAAPRDREWRRLVEALDRLGVGAGLASDARFADGASRTAHDGELAAELAAIFSGRAAAEWERDLAAAGVGCVEVASEPFEALLLDDREGSYGRAADLVVDVEHPALGVHPRLTALAHLSRSPTVLGRGCLMGEHTDLVLAELGYGPESIARLRAEGVVGG